MPFTKLKGAPAWSQLQLPSKGTHRHRKGGSLWGDRHSEVSPVLVSFGALKSYKPPTPQTNEWAQKGKGVWKQGKH